MTPPTTTGTEPDKAQPAPGAPRGGLLRRVDPAGLTPLAWPIYLELMSGVIAGIITVVWVGRLGAAELSAVTVASSLENVLLGVILAVSGGATVALSRAVGAEDHSRVKRVLGTTWRVTVVVTAVTCVTLFLIREPLARLILGENDARALQLAHDYLSIAIPGIAVYYGQNAVDSAFKAHGDTRTPMRMAMLANGILLVLDPVLIFGLLGMPELGVTGAALALVTSRTLVLLWTVGLYLRADFRRRAHQADDGSAADQPSPLREIWQAGTPMAVDFFVRMTAGMLVVGVIARFGTDQVAAYGAITKGLLVLSMAAYAIRQAATIAAARARGAGEEQGLTDTRSSTIRLGVGWSLLSGIIVLVGAAPALRLTTDDPAVHHAASGQAPWMAVYIALLLCNVVLSGVFLGGGQGGVLAYVTLASAGLQAVLAPALSSTALELRGVWLAMIANAFTQTLTLLLLAVKANSAVPTATHEASAES
ncbi:MULTISPECIES: MATE family efflux transporter [Streptomyces]|uniref:MATE family efflux transporter n=1 Tax=Streptomyces TaxID=1883 RepID=UPI000A3A0CE3|nr:MULTISPECIES: MATE family efflux transporter [Streptomyces]MDN5385461.1 MATE family efflux transporter [Streptomyces sp. LB8]MDN5385470.1 MATE family efflux transporter [Streptomyces sp. LB8]